MTELTAESILTHANELKLLCIGDIMLDRFVYGQIDRVSPEAPVPILREKRRTAMPGGAANVARNLASLGAAVTLIGVVGDDAEGRELAQLVGEIDRVTGDLISIRGRPTTLKTRFVAGGQQMIRVDAEDGKDINAVAESQIIAAISDEVASAHGVVLSDYAKGLLTTGIINAAVAAAQKQNIPISVDPKGKDFQRYGPVDVIKPNASELSLATGLPVDSDLDTEAALARAFELSQAKSIIVTRAAKGMSYALRGSSIEHKRGRAREVYEVSGAGDTSIAALALGVAAQASLDASVGLAIAASGIAVGKFGTAAVSAEEVQATFEMGQVGGGVSYMPLPDLKAQVDAWRDRGLVIGFTNGCFDILHPGHLRVLEEAKSRCGRLIVGLNSDASVKRLKGESRPVNDAASRARVLNGLSAVDAVVVFDEDTPANLISVLAPDLLVKGGDYTVETIVGAEDVIRNGGQVHIVPIVEGQSTTASIARAKA